MADEPTPEPTPSFTQEDVNRINAKANRRIQELEQRLESAPKAETIAELNAKIEALTEDKDAAGKSEIEKLQMQHARELEKQSQKAKHWEEEIKTRDEAVAAATQRLRGERLQSAFTSALQAAKVYGPAADDARAVLLGQLKDVEVDDNGAIRASYGGELIDAEPVKIAEKFLVDRPHFATGTTGGAGTRQPNAAGTGGQRGPLHEQNANDLFDLAGPMPEPSKSVDRQ